MVALGRFQQALAVRVPSFRWRKHEQTPVDAISRRASRIPESSSPRLKGKSAIIDNESGLFSTLAVIVTRIGIYESIAGLRDGEEPLNVVGSKPTPV
jgi:hypothetical protein